MAERSSVRYGTTTIRFQVRRSKGRKQVSLVVQAGRADVLVLAPAGIPLDRLAAVVRERAAWAAGKLREVAQASSEARAREFVSGEGFTYLGRSLRLEVKHSKAPGRPRLDRGWLVAVVPLGKSRSARQRAARAQVVEWFKAKAAGRLPERLEVFTKKLGLATPKLMLRSQASRWGSCNERGEVRINWRVIQAPMALVDYVVAHEVVHLLHKGHTREFWAELGRLLPDAEARRRELRRRGAGYVW